MDTKSSNPCVRCGKERIDSKSWKEKVVNFMGTITVVHTQTVCPDPECQKIVERDIEIKMKRKDEFEKDKIERANLRKAAPHGKVK